MKAIQLKRPGEFTIIDHPDPGDPGPGQARARVKQVGLCGTDIHAFGGRQPFFTYPRILGHELGVEIEAVGADVENLSPGMTCAVEPYLTRPGGRAFARGKTNCAQHTGCMGVHADGGMTGAIVLPAHHFHPAPLPPSNLALVETLCIGYHAVKRARVRGDEKVAVIGMGPIGLGVATFARQAGLEVVAVDCDAGRLARAQSLVDPAHQIELSPDQNLAATWTERFEEGPEIIWDCTGNRASMEASIETATHGGTVVFVGLVNESITFDDPRFHRRELTLMASRNAVAADFRGVMAAMMDQSVDVAPWMTHRVAAPDFPGVIGDWLKPESGLLKGIIEIPSDWS